MPALLSQLNALFVAFFSTGSVIKLKSVDSPKITIPNHSSNGNVSTRIIPNNRTHITHFEVEDIIGTKAERIFKGAYPKACCKACPVSCAATAAAATLRSEERRVGKE